MLIREILGQKCLSRRFCGEGISIGLATAENRFAKNHIRRTLSAMNTVDEIKAAIGQLPLEERAALIAKLCGWTDDDWDRRMKADAEAGKFAAMNEDAGNTYREGRTKRLDDILDQA